MSHSFIAIHDKSQESRILYISSGVRQAMGTEPQQMIGHSAYVFMIDDSYSQSYSSLQCGDTDETSVAVMHINTKHENGELVASRVFVFSCDTCNVIIAVMYPGRVRQSAPTMSISRPPLAPVSILDRASRETQLRSCMVLEQPQPTEVMLPNGLSSGVTTSPGGPKIVFVTNSISRLLDTDGDELVGMPFLKLVAPESLADAARFLDDMLASNNVVFARLFLLYRLLNSNSEGSSRSRIEVEIVGAHSDDGAVLLCRMIRYCAAPRKYLGSGAGFQKLRSTKEGVDSGYRSLAELISSDPDTSDCPLLFSREAPGRV
ncbi:hypothetical protein H4R99_002089 [Coemansia sp. RSA 1722]|nr:hypothetical protein LPJ57_002510 [Coemansia sp. RSA 486]KAJ2231006.1 hypothetical protein IWW45_005600 [Coemansia sp. RSA 485]KAJ2603993.1 hypothetical protein H4R99_002089 [Coemansia sp. RSA 1722]